MTMILTSDQRYIARLALGLFGGRTVSNRNRFFAAPGSAVYGDLLMMVEKGAAVRDKGSTSDGTRRFEMTPAGAMAALDPGERLDPEAFPGEAA